MEQLKQCRRCLNDCPTSWFGKNKRRKDGLADYCKPCKAVLRKLYRARHPEQRKAEKARYRKAHPEKVKASRNRYSFARYHRDHEYAEKQREAARCWMKANPVRHKANAAAWRMNNPDAVQAYWRTDAMRNAASRSARSKARSQKMVSELSDAYVRSLISSAAKLRASDVPKELIEARRIHLKIRRLLWRKSK